MKSPAVDKILTDLKTKFGVIGRETEIANLVYCLQSGKNVLIEGPVGVGKTFLLSAVANYLSKNVIRVDGDSRYTEQKLVGWFDPPSVLKKGYGAESYFDGPLGQAMRGGAILFVNEMNRMPEGVQNVLLPALDERKIEIPRIGSLEAKIGFAIVATQNPREFVATSHLSEALLDRFELITLGYQDENEEREILKRSSRYKKEKNEALLEWCLLATRATRESPLFRRGASIRAAISLYDIASSIGGDFSSVLRAAMIALPTRVELSEEGIEIGLAKAIEQSTEKLKKKSLSR